MSSVATKQSPNLAGNKRRSLSGQGGLLNRMFGSSNNSKEDVETPVDSEAVAPDTLQTTASPSHFDAIEESKDEVNDDMRSPTRKSTDESPQPGDKKRRSSGVGRARDLFSSAKQSLSNNFTAAPESRNSSLSPFQKLGRTDPALSVPQGSLNNSAGESLPGPRSTFRVGVTEDKNKKCRRTMEDTHAYLYNFLSTPAPSLTSDTSSKKTHALSPVETSQSQDSAKSDPSATTTTSGSRDIVETDNGYFAIFDGHAGSFAAEWCGKKVHVLLEDNIRKNPNTPIPELLDMTFTSVDQQLEKLPLKNSGCTAVTAVLRWEDRVPSAQSATGSASIAPATAAAAAESSHHDANPPAQDVSESAKLSTVQNQLKTTASRQRVLYTANVGDARIILCRNGKALRLSYDHKGSDENEGKRIAGAGGLILNNRVNGVLAVTRALGDAYMKDLVTGHPYTTETVIQPEIDEFLILACDGLWDVCTDQEAVDLVREVEDPLVASKKLVEYALARFSTDNLSCMIVRFDNHALQQAQTSGDSMIGVEGDPSTQSGGLSEVDAIVKQSKRNLADGLMPVATPTTSEVMEDVQVNQEPGPELNPAALEAARKDQPPSLGS